MKALLLAFALVLSGCAGQPLPRWKASIGGNYNGIGYSATYDGKTIQTDLDLNGFAK